MIHLCSVLVKLSRPCEWDVNLQWPLKNRIKQLKQMKQDFFYNKSHNYRLIEHEETAIFRDILNEEINQRQERIRILNQSKHKQQTFLETRTEQTELDFKIEIERLNAEIGELIEQKRNLKDERPFIWSIEFSEIFFEHGGFDIIIGNPPYLRQEDISDPNCHLDSQAYKEALLEMLRIDFPDYFANPRRSSTISMRNTNPAAVRTCIPIFIYVRCVYSTARVYTFLFVQIPGLM